MASRGGIEPPACPLGGDRSILLSYRDCMKGKYRLLIFTLTDARAFNYTNRALKTKF
jgi:hypothetical protein